MEEVPGLTIGADKVAGTGRRRWPSGDHSIDLVRWCEAHKKKLGPKAERTKRLRPQKWTDTTGKALEVIISVDYADRKMMAAGDQSVVVGLGLVRWCKAHMKKKLRPEAERTDLLNQ